MMKNYWEGILDCDCSCEDDLEHLLLTHNCDYSQMESMLQDGGFKRGKLDQTLDDEVIFFYLGRPAYVPGKKHGNCPSIMAFAWDNNLLSDLNWTPIDSGIFQYLKKDSGDHLFKGMNERDFKSLFLLSETDIDKNRKALLKHIALQFGSFNKYYDGEIRTIKEDNIGQSVYLLNQFLHSLVNKEIEVDEDFFEGEKDPQSRERLKLSLDRRVKLLEGHSNFDVKFRHLKLEFAFVPFYAKSKVKEYFNGTDDYIFGYDPSGSDNTSNIIVGMHQFNAFLSKRSKQND